MKMIIVSAAFVLLFSSLVLSQESEESKEKRERERRDKLETIMRMQDRRTISDGKLISFFSDPDPLVRERAVSAYGSLQDTSIISLLVDKLFDERPEVQFAAAFAIGQTASQLSKNNKQVLEHDLIWARIDRMNSAGKDKGSPADRMIEEIGKFGTEEALNDLILRFGTVYARPHANSLIMSIARFGIRSITSDEAIRYLMTFVKPTDTAPWQAVYALQRIGNNKLTKSELENIIQLSKHHDPLVRMNFAALFGKIKDEKTSLEPLQNLADYDGDWRVRVNALKALGNFNLQNHNEIFETFRRSFFHGNLYVSTTAVSTFGTISITEDSASSKQVREVFDALRRIATNKDNGYLWQLQGEAAIALAKLQGEKSLKYIRISDYPQRLLNVKILQALGESGSLKAMPLIESYLVSDKDIIFRTALEALQTLSQKNSADSILIERTYKANVEALGKRDVAVLTTAASVLGDSLFLRESSVGPLIEKLSSLRAPDDVEAMQEICSTLGKLKSRQSVPVLTSLLSQSDRSIALAAASALKSITGKDYSGSVAKSFEPLWTDFDFQYLRSLPDTIRVKIETIRGDIVADLYKNIAPFTVMNVLKLATQRGFYRGLPFHRVVPNFVIQGGDPRRDGWGGPGYSIRSEFSPLTYETGMLGIASSGKDTEGSQFFIMQSPHPHLDGRYTIFGKVVSGMEVVNKIQVDDHMFDVKIVN